MFVGSPSASPGDGRRETTNTMASSRKKPAGDGSRDERYRKIAGFSALTVSLYLCLAFISYLFTWKADADGVLTYGWRILFTDVEVANWLGPLGAISAHTAFFNGFGATSFLLVYLLGITGLAILQRRPLVKLQRQLRWGLAGLMGLSIMLAFLFQMVDFPVGGAYGYLVASFLENLIGVPGMLLLIALVVVVLVVWIFDPSLDEIRSGQLLERVELKAALPGGITELVGRFQRRGTDSDGSGKGTASTGAKSHNSTIISYEDEVAAVEEPPAKSTTQLPLAEDLAPAAEPDQPSPAPVDVDAFDISDLGVDGGATQSASPVDMDDLDMEVTYARGDEDFDNAEEDEPTAATDATGAVPNAFAVKPGDNVRDILAAEGETEAEEQGPYDPKLDLSDYRYPEISLLVKYPDIGEPVSREELIENKGQIVESLRSFGLEIISISATVGPTITLYEIVPAPGVRISKFRNISDDIALSLSALGIRIIAPIPGRGSIGIEVPNKSRQMVALRDVLMSEKFRKAKMALPIALGKTIQNETLVVDLAKMPHLLIAGATGQGKSVGINTIIMSLLYKQHPAEVKLVLVDPKKVELSLYSRLENHFLTLMPGQEESIITENKKVINTLNSLVIEMDERYKLLKLAGVRHITEYNQKFTERRLNPNDGHKFLPYIVMIIDEFADLIMTAGKEIEAPIARIAQLARAVGMHLIIATQRPSVKIITGAIKANFPARLAFRVTSLIDSRTILDSSGAEQLVGQGDMLLSQGTDNVRIQCAFVDTPEVDAVLEFIGEQQGFYDPYMLPEFIGEDDNPAAAERLTVESADEKLREAAHVVVDNLVGSTSLLQRRMEVGFNRAGRIMDQLCMLGIVGEARGSKPREVMVRDIVELEHMLDLFYGGS